MEANSARVSHKRKRVLTLSRTLLGLAHPSPKRSKRTSEHVSTHARIDSDPKPPNSEPQSEKSSVRIPSNPTSPSKERHGEFANKSPQNVSDDTSPDIEEVYSVERLIGRRLIRNKFTGQVTVQYRVKWHGYDTDSNTWEPRCNLFSADVKSLVNTFDECHPFSLNETNAIDVAVAVAVGGSPRSSRTRSRGGSLWSRADLDALGEAIGAVTFGDDYELLGETLVRLFFTVGAVG